MLFVGDEFGDGAAHFSCTGFAAEFEVGEAFCAEFFGFFGEGVEGFAGERGAAAGNGDELDGAAGFDGAFEDGGVGGFGPGGDVFEFEAVAHVGAVDAEAVHGFLIFHDGQGGGEVDVEDLFPESHDEAGDELDDFFAVDEGHFEIELGEFGLAVGAQVFIAEAAGDLHVTFQPPDHQHLLEKLWRLRQGVKAAGVESGGDEEFAGPFGGGFVEDRRFDFEEAVLVAIVAHDLDDLVARDEGVGHFLAAKVEVAVFEARVFGDSVALRGGEGDGIGLVDEFGGGDDDFDFAGGHFGIGSAFFAGPDCAGDGDDVFVAERAADLVGLAGFGMKDDLGDAGAVAEIDEDDAAVVAVSVDPAGEADFGADVGFTQDAAGVGAFEGHVGFPVSSFRFRFRGSKHRLG